MSDKGRDFSPGVKLQARRRAAFRCCYCRDRMGDHVHHLDPKEEGGSNDLDNAMLLCVMCHELYGPKKDKRTQLRQARDAWYEIVELRYSADAISALEVVAKNVATKEHVDQAVGRLLNGIDAIAQAVRGGHTDVAALTNIESTVVSTLSARPFQPLEPFSYVRACLKCGKTWTSSGRDECPHCKGAPDPNRSQ